MEKNKICITLGHRINENTHQAQTVFLVSRLDDRIKTIALLKEIENGDWWESLAVDYLYELDIISEVIEDDDIIKCLLGTTLEKWEAFVNVFLDEENTIFQIKTI